MKRETEESKVRKLLECWNDARLEIAQLQAEIDSRQEHVEYLRDQMMGIPSKLENVYCSPDSFGEKIGDDYVVVIRMPDDSLIIQTINFILREEIKNS